MSATCPAVTPALVKGSPLHQFTLAITIIYPIFVVLSVLYFYVNRKTSVFLRKREFFLIAFSCLGSASTWSVTVLFDYLGPENYPCALFGLLYYASTPIVGGPILVRGLAYIVKVSQQFLAWKGENITGEASIGTLLAHLRVVCLSRRGDKDKQNAARFARTKLFWTLWISVTVSPYLIAYVVRVATEPTWMNGCYGCHLFATDAAILLAINTVNMSIACIAYSFRVKKRDPLRIIRECLIGIVSPMPFLITFYGLTIIDPNDTYKNGGVNWASITLAGSWIAVYIQTIHQVLVAKRIKRKLLLSENFDRDDRFDDVMNDKELKHALQNYLNSELSGEILMFIEACDQMKLKFAQDRLQGSEALERIYRTFVEKNRATYEINLPSSVREAIAHKMKGPLDPSIMDEAYADVKKELLRDGFIRFLNRLKVHPIAARPTLRKGFSTRGGSQVVSRIEDV